jgi:hypothetical protein
MDRHVGYKKLSHLRLIILWIAFFSQSVTNFASLHEKELAKRMTKEKNVQNRI